MKTKRIKKETLFEVKCVCCGKKFKTTDPKQDTCLKCSVELIEFLSM